MIGISRLEITLIILAFVGAGTVFGTWKLTKGYYVSKYEAQISSDKLVAQKRITELTEKKLETERQLGVIRNELDKKYNKTIKDLNVRVDTLKRDNVRLRDPGYDPNGSDASTNSGTTSGNSGTNSGEGTLSKQASEFLFEYAGEADRTLEQLRVCKAWVDDVRTTMNSVSKKQQKEIDDRKKKEEKRKK